MGIKYENVADLMKKEAISYPKLNVFNNVGKDFGFFTVEESESDLKIIYEEYVPDKEEPVSSRIIK